MMGYLRLAFVLIFSVSSQVALGEPPAPQEASQQEEQAQPECREAGANGPEEVVRLLYQRYPPGGGKVIENEPQGVLRKYFDGELAALFFRDHQCKVKEQGVCRLDASTMYDSQDPGAGDLLVCRMDAAKYTVAVHFWGGNGRMTVTYQLRRTGAGWRISNMLYPNGRTIMHALSVPFP